jgi:hypothetical protein
MHKGTIDSVTKEIEVPGCRASELFERAYSWMKEYFKNSESVIEFPNRDAGLLNGMFVISGIPVNAFGDHGDVRALITIEIKAQRASINIDFIDTVVCSSGTTVGFIDTVCSSGITARLFSATGISEKGYEMYLEEINMLIADFEKAVTHK